MKKIFSISFFVLTWFVCVGQTQPFSLVSPSNESEPIVMFDNSGEFLFEYPYQYSESVYTDKVNHFDNCTEVRFGGFTYILNYSQDCQWISSYDLFNQNHWLEGFVFIIAEDVILLNSMKDE